MGLLKKKIHRKRYPEVSQIAIDRKGWRAAIYQQCNLCSVYWENK
jgi:hypothetical protein